jgi:hypothetical protein
MKRKRKTEEIIISISVSASAKYQRDGSGEMAKTLQHGGKIMAKYPFESENVAAKMAA